MTAIQPDTSKILQVSVTDERRVAGRSTLGMRITSDICMALSLSSKYNSHRLHTEDTGPRTGAITCTNIYALSHTDVSITIANHRKKEQSYRETDDLSPPTAASIPTVWIRRIPS